MTGMERRAMARVRFGRQWEQSEVVVLGVDGRLIKTAAC